ncbi:uncharacterized protein BDR25DRAFT_99435 [Lindgomyces ingoldianus]|uniref:Uncharacterized protein n=1 Tax=Lindgomyces ingoldianus TaxID=673940 RepID=A0ACB6QBX0_9PLEO|nr:uncharacterized protein BDR25DRAFT_99435 [Lindgomyces ingoldianus]KAF2464093.1 hypothetical protein BDR25DRAFT_99435 [Lindgomyces ingoldianus]
MERLPRPFTVLSFMSEWGGNATHRRTPSSTGTSPVPPSPTAKQPPATTNPSASSTSVLENYDRSSPGPAAQPRSDSRPSSRPMSMIQTYQPPVMEVGQDTLPELQRIFQFLNSHSNKLYQEGYFLKFHDTDSRGRPAPDRVWQECFAQLVGTILSLWDASALDQVGGDAEVLPTFINLTDAAIHMMPSMTLSDGKKLDNILSVSTAAHNKYLFHFNSFNSLTQWTAGIRLAMFEHTTLQEAYTGALIAGKGKQLNNIRIILDRQRAKHEDWARVRFGAGTPWRRCWCVVTPPDEKEYARLQKTQKKANIYNRSPVVLKGDMKFYETKKVTKKTLPIATVKEAYSCYAIYPQSKPLIDQSTLVKIEGNITIHSNPESTTEGFVFVMPETHPAVSGFEIMLRFLFPVFDTFALYGRPTKLISDVLDSRGLMFAMPPDRRYGYLEMWDVVSLIHADGSHGWSERQWRKELKDLTSKRMTSTPSQNQSRAGSRTGSRRNTVSRTSLPPSRSGTLRFEEPGSIRSQPSTRQASPTRPSEFETQGPRRVDSAPPSATFATPRHQRSVSETNGYKQYQADTPSRLAYGVNANNETPPPPPEHRVLNGTPHQHDGYDTASDGTPSPDARNLPYIQTVPLSPPHGPVALPPGFAHAPSQRPPVHPHHPPEKPRPHMDEATLHQLADATHAPLPAGVAVAGAAAAWRSQENLSSRRSGEHDRHQMQMQMNANAHGYPADQYLQGTANSRSGNRLPTIPASPYIEQPEFVESPIAFQPTAPPVPEHAEMPQPRPSLELAQRPGSQSSQIHRKPVPGRSSISSREAHDNLSTKSSSLGSLRNDIVDPEALDSLNNTDPTLLRQQSQSSSRYDDDNVSSSTPDYASTISEEIQPRKLPERREERPRSGVLKFVGNPDIGPKADVVVGDAHYNSEVKQPAEPSSDIPTIDFGPTYSLNPDSKRPGTSGTMTQALHDHPTSQSKENLAPSPNEQKRVSYLSGRTTPIAAAHMRTSSNSPQAEDRRSIAWSPGMTAQPQTQPDRQKLDPEEWVQQRAVNAYQPRASPVYTHGRNQSHTPPPINRTQSGEWTHLQKTPEAIPARPPSRPLSRPLSRGTGLLLDQRPTSLSAREQEQVARMTGTPLIDLSKNPKENQKTSSAGLTAYIDHREQEKAAAKANRHTAAMQAEIDRRMMAAQQRQMMEMQQMGQQMVLGQGGYGAPAMMGTPQAYPQAFAYSSPAQMQQQQQAYQKPGYFPPQSMSPMPPQGIQQGWGTPSSQPMQGQYFAPQQQQMQPQMQHAPQQQQPVMLDYGASFDQAQAAARIAHQQGKMRRG